MMAGISFDMVPESTDDLIIICPSCHHRIAQESVVTDADDLVICPNCDKAFEPIAANNPD